MLRTKGYSLAAWVITFSVIVAAIFLVRVSLNRALQSKVMGVTDYMLWTKWDKSVPPQQYKGDDTSFVKTTVGQDLNTKQTEKEGFIKNDADSVNSEDTASSSVEEGSQAVLKTINLNDLQP